MKKSERIIKFETVLSGRDLENLSYLHDLMHSYYKIITNNKNISIMSWTDKQIIIKHKQIVDLLEKEGYKHNILDNLDKQKTDEIKLVRKNHEEIDTFETLFNKLNKKNQYSIYKYKANRPVSVSLTELNKNKTINLYYEIVTYDFLIEFLKRFPGKYLIHPCNEITQSYIIDLKPNLKPMVPVLGSKGAIGIKNNNLFAFHKTKTLRRETVLIEGEIEKFDKRALNRIKNNMKKVCPNNYIAIGRIVKVGKKYLAEYTDILFFDKMDISKESEHKRKELLKNFKDKKLTHICVIK